MSRKDRFHIAVKHALEKDGWTITHDPLPLNIGGLRLEVESGSRKTHCCPERQSEDCCRS